MNTRGDLPLLRRADGGMQLFTSADTPDDRSMLSVVMDKSAEESIWAPPLLPSMPSRKEPTPSFVLGFGLEVALLDGVLMRLMRADDGENATMKMIVGCDRSVVMD